MHTRNPVVIAGFLPEIPKEIKQFASQVASCKSHLQAVGHISAGATRRQVNIFGVQHAGVFVDMTPGDRGGVAEQHLPR